MTNRSVSKAYVPSPEREDEDPKLPMTLQQVADIWGVSKERVRQIETEALAKFRDGMRERCQDMRHLIHPEK